MNITTLLIIVTVFASIAIIALTLMQQSKGDMGSAFGGGGSQSMFGSRGSANFLSRATSVMVTVFFVSALALAYLYSKRNNVVDSVDPLLQEQTSDVPTLDINNTADSVEASDVPQIPNTDSLSESIETQVQDLETPNIEAQTEIEAQVEPVPEVPQLEENTEPEGS